MRYRVCGQATADANELARSGAIRAVESISPHLSLYDVRMEVYEAEGRGATYITCSVLGSLVRRVRATLPIAPPISTVNLAS